MAIIFNDNIRINASKPSDDRYGPYISTNEANNSIPQSIRFNGLIFGVYDNPSDILNSDIIYYYYTRSCTDNDIVILLKEYVRYDVSNQNLTSTQQQNARQNINAQVAGNYLISNLTNTQIFIGNASNVPVGRVLSLNSNSGTFGLSNTGVLTIPNASTNTRGLLSSTDWNTFNNKQNTITGQPLTNVNDTNVILTLSGNTSTSLLNPVNITVSWNGLLSPNRGGTGIGSYIAGNYINALNSTTLQQRTPTQVLSDIGAEPQFTKGNIIKSNGINITGILTSRLYNTGDINFSVNAGIGLTQETNGLRLTSINANTNSQGALFYNGFTRSSGFLYGGPTIPNGNTRLNYDGYFHSTRLITDTLVLNESISVIPTTRGSLFWDIEDNVVGVSLGNILQRIGEDQFFAVENRTGSLIPKGTNVRFAGTLGSSGKLLIAPFIGNGSTPSSFYMGVTAEDIPNDGSGKVYNFGRIRGLDTSMFSEGDVLYASTTVAGGFQTTVPIAPNNIIQVAAVIVSHQSVGTIMVRPTIGSNINKDEGVKVVNGLTGDILQLQANGLFENKSKAQYLGGNNTQFVKGDGSLDNSNYLTSVNLGYSPSPTNGSITNSAGSNSIVPLVNTTNAGLMSPADKTKINSVQDGAQVNVPTNLSYDNSTRILSSSTGTNVTLPLATSTVDGLRKLSSDIIQTVSPNSITTTTGRTYGLQVNSSGQLVVNVPWVDTNTIYTHPTYTVRNETFTGAEVLSNFTSDSIGSVTGITKRTLTLGNLGYTGATNADNYSSWNLRTNGVQRTTIVSGGILDIVGGTNVTVSYGAGGVVTLSSTDTNTTYTAGAGLTLTGTSFSLPVSVSGSGSFVQSVVQNTGGITVTLGTPPDNNTTYSAGTGLSLSTTTFNVIYGTTSGTSAQGNDSRINNGQTSFTWGDHRAYNTNSNYIGGGYISGGLEKPNNSLFGSGKLKLQMLSGGNLGGGTTWNDVIWMSSYTGSDVKGSNTLILGKTSEFIGFARQDYDSASWGTVRTIYHSGNFNPGSYVLTSTVLTAGDGLSGGGNLTTSRSFAVDSTVVRTSGNQTIGGIKTFTSTISGSITGNASTANNLTNIITTFSGTYPLTVNVNGVIYSNSNITFNGTTNTLTTSIFSGSLSGNASTATTLQTARIFTIGNTGKSFNGSANVSWSLAEIGAAATSHTHDATQIVSGTISSARLTGTYAISISGNATTATTLQTARTINNVSFNGSANITLRQFFGTGNDYNTAGIEVVGNGSTNTVFPSVGFHQPGLYASSLQLRSSNNFHFIAQGGTTLANAHALTFFGALSGNATTATTLQTARTINGTSFNGSANIITSTWGTARTLTIGNTGKSVNGGGNVSWSLAEIGAAANTITLSGGDGITTTIGNLTTNRSISVDSTVVRTSGNQNIGGQKIFTSRIVGQSLTTASTGNEMTLLRSGSDVIGVARNASIEIGNTTTSRYHMLQHNTDGFRIYYFNGSGWTQHFILTSSADGRFTGDVISYSSSDRRLKDNLTLIPNSLEKINKLGGYSFEWNNLQESYTGKDYGIVAQEVEELFPEMVTTRENGYKAVKYDRLIPVLIEAIKELNIKIKILEDK